MARAHPAKAEDPDTRAKPSAGLALAALGVVFGDLATSPLYTLQTVVHAMGGRFTADSALGVLSLVVWTLIVSISVKYALFVMRADNHGEGGILALMSLVGCNSLRRGSRMLALMGLAGAALIYGDGVITPSISVLSALEGLDLAAPHLKPFVMPGAVAILALLFASQRFGSSRIGAAFGPIMLIWLVSVGALGLMGVLRHPEVIKALNPAYAARLLAHSGPLALGVLGGVFLCITGGEALYADMGHFGKGSIRLAWYGLVLPALLLSYAGQTGLLLQSGQVQGNPFYQLAPGWALGPLILLATLATIIASQAILTGSFSMTRQAMQLGWAPGLDIEQTSDEVYGQIYVPAVNALMMAATIAITIGFKSSDRLAGAYGAAVSTTMVMTTGLLIAAMHKIWRWPAWRTALVGGLFLVVDLAYFGANLTKVAEGGWLPLGIGAILFGAMIVWRLGRGQLAHAGARGAPARDRALEDLRKGRTPRPEGVAIFLTRPHRNISPVILEHVAHLGALQRRALAVSVDFRPTPRVPADERTTTRELEAGITAVRIRFGFVEIPNIPLALAHAEVLGKRELEHATYFSPRDHVAMRPRPLGPTRARLAVFIFLLRNRVRAVDLFRLPTRQVVEIGREIEL